MRLLFRLIILTILGFSQTINDELKELNGATPQRRVELMNHIKEQLIIMNQEERSKTIAKLRAKLQPSFSHQPNQYNQNSSTHQDIVPNHIPIHNNYQEIQIYQEHIPDIITHREEHIHRTTTIPTNSNNNHNEPIDRTPTIPSNTNTNHNEPVDITPTIPSNTTINNEPIVDNRTPTVPTNTNTDHNEPIVDRTPTVSTNTNTNHNEPTVDRIPTVPTNTNTDHNEPIDRTPTVPSNTNTDYNEPIDNSHQQEETTSSSGHFNSGRR